MGMMAMEDFKTNYLFYQSRKELSFVDYAEGLYIYDTSGKEYLTAVPAPSTAISVMAAPASCRPLPSNQDALFRLSYPV